MGDIGVVLPETWKLIPEGLTGDYRSLGYPLGLPVITDENLLEAVNAVSGYNPPIFQRTNPVLSGIARLIIAVNEAVRFDQVENGINRV